jgi:hypothetical protein
MQNCPTEYATISTTNHQRPLDCNRTDLDHPLIKLESIGASKLNGGYSAKHEGGIGYE